MIVLISMISFFLDGILSRYILLNSLFLPLFTIVSLVIIYPYFNNDNFRYFKFIAIIGLLYDIAYFNTLFYNFFIFIALGFIIGLINYLLSNNIYTNILMTVASITTYRIITFLITIIFKTSYPLSELLQSIYSSLILNIIYCLIIYIITELYSKKNKILRSK